MRPFVPRTNRNEVATTPSLASIQALSIARLLLVVSYTPYLPFHVWLQVQEQRLTTYFLQLPSVFLDVPMPMAMIYDDTAAMDTPLFTPQPADPAQQLATTHGTPNRRVHEFKEKLRQSADAFSPATGSNTLRLARSNTLASGRSSTGDNTRNCRSSKFSMTLR